jgi:hypothetical protein
MIRILLDECLDVKLKYRFQECNPDFQVSTVTARRWSGIKNGKLLTLAQRHFEIFITVDQNLPHQHVLSRYTIAVIILKAPSNRYKDLIKLVNPACEIIESAKSGKIYEVASIVK